jgi:two-component system, CitB family, sensor kinase
VSPPSVHFGRRPGMSLAGQVFVLQAVLVVLLLAGVGVLSWLQLTEDNRAETAEEMLGIAHTLAATPDVLGALDDADPTAVLQPLAETVRRDTATDFVVVMTPQGLRWSHPDTEQIGRRFLGTIGPAAAGVDDFTETYTGTLGPSVRAVVPVRDEGGRVVALVSAGRTLTNVSAELLGRVPVLLAAAAGALALAGLGSWLVSRWVRRTTRDLGRGELARMYTYYDAVLHAVREGLLLLDRDGRIALVNDEARRLLPLPADVHGRRADEIGLPAGLGGALVAGGAGTDEMHLTADRIVVVNRAPARFEGRELGTVVTLRDLTELRALGDELDTIRGFAHSLNAQAHEAANQLHTVVALIELGRPEEALQYAATELELAQRLTDTVVAGIAVPELAALVVGKAAAAGERGVELDVAEGTRVPDGVADPRDLVTIVGNLLDNAVDAALEGPREDGVPPRVRLDAGPADGGLVLCVSDSGPGLDPADAERVFTSGWTTKPSEGMGRGLGLALVRRAVQRHGGTVEVVPGGPGARFRVWLP